jgi:protein involved in polysaccharide export with SLBB domain
VIGEVVRPGLYSVDPTLNVFDLLAVAGGPTSMAKQDRIQLVRGGEQIRVSLDPAAVARATLRELGVRSGDQLLVPRKAITRDEWGILLQLVNTVLLAYTIFR